MKLKKGSRKNSALSSWAKALLIYLAAATPSLSVASPSLDISVLSPGSFSVVEDEDLLSQLGLVSGPAWCYDVNANAVIITAPARERAQCELRLMYETEKQKVKFEFEIDKLKIRVDTLSRQHEEIMRIKNQEIDRLTQAALKRPNDYTYWWATGGFLTGSLLTLAVVFTVK